MKSRTLAVGPSSSAWPKRVVTHSCRQLHNWRMAGLIPYFKLGKAVRFRAADVATAIERMRIG
jgi:hypothetical protein